MYVTKHAQLASSINKNHLNIFDCGYASVGCDWHSDVVKPSYSRLYFILDGESAVDTDRGRYHLEAGKCYLLPSLFSFKCICQVQMRQYYFHISLLDEHNQDLFSAIAEPLECTFDSNAEKILKTSIEADSPDTFHMMQMHALLLMTIGRLLETKQITLSGKIYSSCVSHALQYIQKNISAQLCVSEVAEHTFVSQSTLAKHFRQELGLTIGRYIDNLVFTQSQFMLRDSSLSIAEISEQLGFCDQFYFSSRFKHHYRVSPQSFRKNIIF